MSHFHDSLSSPSFFFNPTATTEIYTLSLHDALPILGAYYYLRVMVVMYMEEPGEATESIQPMGSSDRKSTRLNSSHRCISYAVFCLKKKKLKYLRKLRVQGIVASLLRAVGEYVIVPK